MGKILPVLLALIGLGAGIGGGLALRPDPQTAVLDNPCGDIVTAEHSAEIAEPETDDISSAAFVKLSNQFIVPVVSDQRISSLVVLSLSLEVQDGGQEVVFRREPKLRDAFLQVLFDHANSGGFDGAFTTSGNMVALRNALYEAAERTLGSVVEAVLIVDVVRQDA